MALKFSLSLLAVVSTALAQNCTLQFDGRMPGGSTPASFDAKTSLFGTTNVLGAGLTWSEVIQIPSVTPSLFDTKANTTAMEVTISDASIFNNQTGFRRAELNPASNNGTDASTTGVKTLHFSIMKDDARPLNTSHEYQLTFLETADFSTNQFALKTGTILGGLGNSSIAADSLVLVGNVETTNVLFSTAFTADVWHNFALVNDFTKNTTQVLYSTGSSALTAVSAAVSNDLSGQGEFHFGVLKKPVDGGADITKSGIQESGINEGIIYGGVFEEDSSTGCISLSA